MIYAGIGSRETPPRVLEQMTEIAKQLARLNWTLRSGHADGADLAFELGSDLASGKKQIFLPWRGFNGSTSRYCVPPHEAYTLAATVHPAWENCSKAARALHARNCQQVLGPLLDEPSKTVLAWTKNGDLVGGTATALKLAMMRGIPVLNLGSMPPLGSPLGPIPVDVVQVVLAWMEGVAAL